MWFLSYKVLCILSEQNEECDRDFSYCSQSLVRWYPYCWIMEEQYCGPGISEACWRVQCAVGPVSYLECHSLSTWQAKRWQTMLQVEAHIFAVYWEVDSFCNFNEPYIIFLPPLIFETFTLLTKLSEKLLFLIRNSIVYQNKHKCLFKLY